MLTIKNIIILLSFSFLLPKEISIDLISTNDIHGSISKQKAYFMNPKFAPTIVGGSGLYEYIKNTVDMKSSLIFDGGNFFQGHPISDIDKGKTIIDFMNKVGYTAAVPGPYDFIYGSRNLNYLVDSSEFPFLISNLICNDCDLVSKNFKKYIIKEINGVKIGILGIVDADLKSKVLSTNIMNIEVSGVKESLDYWVPLIKDEVDVVIVLTSTGIPWDREDVYNEFIQKIIDKNEIDYKNLNAVEMGYFSNDVDIIVSGGFSKGYRTPWTDPNTGVDIVQNYGNGTSFGHLKLIIEDNKYKRFDYVIKNNFSQTLLADDFAENKDLSDWIQDKNNLALEKLYKPLDLNFYEVDGSINQVNKNLNEDNWNFPELGNDENFEIITWNCEFFPTADEKTINALSEAIHDMDVDVIAFQEIKMVGWFGRLMEKLPNYDFVISKHSSFMDQAIIFKKHEFKYIRDIEPFAENDYNFAGRPPLRLDLFRYADSLHYSIVNLHMKCCDSGLNRRKNASQMLYDYISNEIDSGYSNFIVLGDWNDDLKDNYGEHCFDPFFNDSRFYFVTQDIVDDMSQASYPKEPYYSFLDHILVTRSFLDDKDYLIKTIRMGDYMGGFNNYEKLISDHLPVLLSF